MSRQASRPATRPTAFEEGVEPVEIDRHAECVAGVGHDEASQGAVALDPHGTRGGHDGLGDSQGVLGSTSGQGDLRRVEVGAHAMAPRQRVAVAQRPGGLDRPGGLVELASQHGAGGQVEVGVRHRLGHVDGGGVLQGGQVRFVGRRLLAHVAQDPAAGVLGPTRPADDPGPSLLGLDGVDRGQGLQWLAEMGVGLGPEQQRMRRRASPRGDATARHGRTQQVEALLDLP